MRIFKAGCLRKGTYIMVDTLRNYNYVAIRSKGIKSDENKAVVVRLVKEVKGLNPSFDAADIRGESEPLN